jgi:hypothetical protein
VGRYDVEYEIRSKDRTKKGLNDAQKNLKGFGKETSKLSKGIGDAFKGAFAATAVIASLKVIGKAVAQFARESIDAFQKQERAVLRLNAALRNNPYNNAQMSRNLQEYASALQQVSVYGDEVTLQQASMLASMGMTETQIKEVLRAATNLASSGMISLESATRNLAKTFGGMSGELGELIPDLRDLSEEQLRNGDAVDFVLERYQGMNEALRESSEGVRTAFQNAFGDLKETLGETLSASVDPFLERLTEVLTTINDTLEAMDEYNRVVAKFGEDSNRARFLREGLIQGRPAPEGLDLGTGPQGNAALDESLRVLGQGGTDQEVEERQRKAAEAAAIAANRELYANLAKAFDPVRELRDQLDTVNEQIGSAQMLRAQPGNRAIYGSLDRILETLYDEQDNLVSQIQAILRPAPGGAGPMAATSFGMGPGGNYGTGPIWDMWSNGAGGDLRAAPQQGPSAFQRLAAGANQYATGVGEAIGGAAGVGGMMQGGLTGNAAELSEAVAAFGALGPAVWGVQEVFEGLMSVLDPMLNAVIDPLAEILQGIGETLGKALLPVLEALAPIIATVGNIINTFLTPVIAHLAPLFNVIATVLEILDPILKAFAVALEIVAAPLNWFADLLEWVTDQIRVTVQNMVIWFENLFRRAAKDEDYVDRPGKFTSDAFSGLGNRIAAIWNETGGDPAGALDSPDNSGPNREMIGRDLTLNFYNQNVVTGDEQIRDLAIIVRDQILELERLGA